MSELNATLIGMTTLDEILGVKEYTITDYDPKEHTLEITPTCGAIFDHQIKALYDTFQCTDILWNAEHGFIISIKDNFYF